MIRLPAGRDARLALAAVALLVALALAAVVADAFVPSPSGPRSSAYATSPAGVAAWAELARRSGVPVREVRARPTAATLGHGGTAVVLDPDGLTGREARALRAFAQRGGRVVAGGLQPGAWLDVLAGPGAPVWDDRGPRTASVLARTAETRGVARVRTAGEGSWSDPGAARALVGAAGAATVALLRAGRGRIVLVADPSFLQNRLLDEADDAALALALGNPGPLRFVEGVHGYGRARGLAALPARFRWALALLAAAAAALILARWRRFGPPEAERRELAPPRRAYVDALGASLARGRRADAALAGVRAAARTRLARRSALPPGAGEEQWRQAAAAAGLDEAAIAALTGSVGDDVTAPGRAYARLG